MLEPGLVLPISCLNRRLRLTGGGAGPAGRGRGGDQRELQGAATQVAAASGTGMAPRNNFSVG